MRNALNQPAYVAALSKFKYFFLSSLIDLNKLTLWVNAENCNIFIPNLVSVSFLFTTICNKVFPISIEMRKKEFQKWKWKTICVMRYLFYGSHQHCLWEKPNKMFANDWFASAAVFSVKVTAMLTETGKRSSWKILQTNEQTTDKREANIILLFCAIFHFWNRQNEHKKTEFLICFVSLLNMKANKFSFLEIFSFQKEKKKIQTKL